MLGRIPNVLSWTLGFALVGQSLGVKLCEEIHKERASDLSKDDRFNRHYERQREAKEQARKGLPGEDEAPLPPPVEPIKNPKAEPGRNDPCPCRSGKKYKQCCLKKD